MHKLQTFIVNRRVYLLVFICLLAVYGLSFYKRQASYTYWMENRDLYVVDHVTAMSAMDAYYWLKMARELDKGTLGKGQADPTKGYPDLAPLAIKDRPSLLAELISAGHKFTGDYYRSGLLLIPILSGLFVFPLFFYFNRIGFGAAAVLGGLIGSFGHAYYDRTMMGRLDTDLLNSFFMLTTACFILPMNREKDWRINACLAAGAGLTMNLFVRWYQQPSFILVYLVVMAVYMIIGRVSWKQVALALPLFLAACGPEYVLQVAGSVLTFLNAYVSPPPAGQVAWPNVLRIVAETQNRGIEVMLTRLHGFLPLVFAGFFGLLYLGLRHFRQMLPVAPLILLGGWALVGPNRFLMYLAPFIGVGIGVLIELLVNYVAKKTSLQSLSMTVASLSLMFILFFSTSAYTGFSSIPAPIIDAATTRALLDIKQIVPKNSAMFTSSWAYGYALMEIGDFATYHDGGLQGGMRTTLIDKSLLSNRQQEIVSLISYLEDNGFRKLNEVITNDKLSADEMQSLVFGYSGEFKGENVYVLYLEHALRKLDTMAFFGTWDFDRKKSHPMNYVELDCFSIKNNVMTCHDGTIDLNSGFMNEGTKKMPLRGALFVNDGYVVDEKYFAHEAGYYLQVLMKHGKIKLILVADEQLFQTNFNQQYLLGNYDRRYFEEVYNNVPVARVFKVRKNNRPEAGEQR